jgi:hypothetical protein
MLCPEVCSPQLELTSLMFYARLGVCILAVQNRKFHNDISKFEVFEMEKLDDATLLDLHPTDTFQFFEICAVVSPAIFSRGDPRFSHDPSILRNFKWA